MKTVYSLDGENYCYDNEQEILRDMIGTTYYKAQAEDATHERFIDANDILEMMDDLIWEELGDCYNNDFFNVSADAKDELKRVILKWAKKHVSLDYWFVDGSSVQKITIGKVS